MYDHHSFVRQWMDYFVKPGDFAVDMTAGNGWDTLALAQRVGENGSVFSVDIQPDAVERTRALIRNESIQAPVRVVCMDHAKLPWDQIASPSFVLYNLGYLPGGTNRNLMTHPLSVLDSVRTALRRLDPKGAICLTVYRTHDADTEHGVLKAGLHAMEDVHVHQFRSLDEKAPIVYCVQPKSRREDRQ